MNDFRFAEMAWLNGAWGVLGCAALLIALELRGRSLLDRMLSPWMQTRLVRRVSLLRRLSRIGLFSLALLALVFALMQPQWGMTVQAQTRVDSQIMICLDVSKSMLAEDVVPNRLDRAKAEIDSLLSLMDDGQQVGLMAFAGKATVLCPMTTDFGFLRLVLAEAGPAVVGLGGTRIGESLQKAVDGFRQSGDLNRMILLITDGEDHDSFPLDAAKRARKKGVRIISIGFGDEAGSKIEYTDPATGARKFVTDRDGVAVVSRLDGDTLRDIALETEGAYIPAGTGALDLQSIYDAHIRTLLRGSTVTEDRIVRNEAYQWCVAGALLLFLASLLVTGVQDISYSLSPALRGGEGRGERAAPKVTYARSPSPPTPLPEAGRGEAKTKSARPLPEAGSGEANTKSAIVVAVLLLSLAGCNAKQEHLNSPRSASGRGVGGEGQSELIPRELYNQAVSLVSQDPDRAEQLLTDARQAAGADGELRFRSLYNLGCVEVTRADRLLEAEPEQALKHLQMAASRFREAIRVRSEDADARYNLEILSRRILELVDSLAQRDPKDLAIRLDELIAMQRSHLGQLQQVTNVHRPDTNHQGSRAVFRQLGVAQRQIVSDMEKLASDAQQELTGIEQGQHESEDNGARMRAAQLSAMLRYVDMSVQRMSKSRSFTRRRQPERAFVRWAAGLTAAKRGRDQLRDPIEILGGLIGDAGELAHLTQLLALVEPAAGNQLPDGELQARNPAVEAAPAWLTGEYLHQTQVSTTERTAELLAILSSGVQENSTQPTDPSSDGSQAMIENIRSALPSIEEAVSAFSEAAEQIANTKFPRAFEQQTKGISALMDAAEFFYDLRRLIEVMYRDERLVQSIAIVADRSVDHPVTAVTPTNELLAAASQKQAKNLSRALRLDHLLDTELETGSNEANADTESGGAAGQSTPEQRESEKQRLELAKQLLGDATSQMQRARNLLAELRPSIEEATPESESFGDSDLHKQPPSPSTSTSTSTEEDDSGNKQESPGSQQLDDAIGGAVQNIGELRRLFFSVVEHLRETAQRQAELNDSTSTLAGTPAPSPNSVGPLFTRQQVLQQTAEQIASALQEQSEQTSQADPATRDDADRQKADESLKQAVELVREASTAMQNAASELTTQDPADDANTNPAEGDSLVDFKSTIAEQLVALEKLSEALTLLDDQQAGEDQDQQQQNDQQEQDQQEQDQQQEQEQAQQQNMNARQLLQLIRDQEAQRRQDKQKANAHTSAAVERDW